MDEYVIVENLKMAYIEAFKCWVTSDAPSPLGSVVVHTRKALEAAGVDVSVITNEVIAELREGD